MAPNRTERGSALIGVMIAAAIAGIIAAGMASLFTDMYSAQNGVKYRSDTDNFHEEIRALLSSPQACLNTFGGTKLVQKASPDVFNFTNFKDGSAAPGVVKYAVGSVFGDRSLSLESIAATDYKDTTVPTGELVVTIRYRTTMKSLGAQSIVRQINLKTSKDGTNNLSGCVALAKMTDGIWQRSGANPGNIFFNGPANAGFVGIGKTAPISLLDVQSDDFATIRLTGTGVRPGGAGYVAVAYTNVPGTGATSLGLYRARGTATAAAAISAGDALGGVIGDGWDGTNWSGVARGSNPPIGIGYFAEKDFAIKPSTYMVFVTSDGTIPPLGNLGMERMRITGAGNVGVGTGAPFWLMQMNGTGETQDHALAINAFSDTKTSSIKLFRARTGSGFVRNQDFLGGVNFSGMWGGKGAAEFRSGETRAGVSAFATENWSDGSRNGTALQFSTTANGTSTVQERMRVDASGNIGVGTTTPQGMIDIGGTRPSLVLPNENTATFAGAGLFFKSSGGALDGRIYEGTGNNLNIIMGSGGYLKFLTTSGGFPASLSGSGTLTVASCSGCSVVAEMMPIHGPIEEGEAVCISADTGDLGRCDTNASLTSVGITTSHAEQLLRLGCKRSSTAENHLTIGGAADDWKNNRDCEGWFPVALSGVHEFVKVECERKDHSKLRFGDRLVTSSRNPGFVRPLLSSELGGDAVVGKALTVCQDGKAVDTVHVKIK